MTKRSRCCVSRAKDCPEMYNNPFLDPVAEMLSWHSCLSSDRALHRRKRYMMERNLDHQR